MISGNLANIELISQQKRTSKQKYSFRKNVTVKRNEYELLLVDTAGQDEYTRFPSEYSIGMHGYVLVYSIDSLR